MQRRLWSAAKRQPGAASSIAGPIYSVSLWEGGAGEGNRRGRIDAMTLAAVEQMG